jgi:hypothetical protein
LGAGEIKGKSAGERGYCEQAVFYCFLVAAPKRGPSTSFWAPPRAVQVSPGAVRDEDEELSLSQERIRNATRPPNLAVIVSSALERTFDHYKAQ